HESRERGGEDNEEKGLAVDVDHRAECPPGSIPQLLVNDWPGCSWTRSSPVRNAFGGHVIGSTARLRRLTSGSGSPLNTITYEWVSSTQSVSSLPSSGS